MNLLSCITDFRKCSLSHPISTQTDINQNQGFESKSKGEPLKIILIEEMSSIDFL